MRPPYVPAVCLVFASIGLVPADAQPVRVAPAGQQAAKRPAIDQAALAAQVALSREGFSPGIIDGRRGAMLRSALLGFQEARGLKRTGQLDAPTRAALLKEDVPATVKLTISPEDAAGPFVASIPEKMEDKAKLPALAYTSLTEALGEKFHTSPQMLAALNPGVEIKAGAVITVPNVRGLPATPPAKVDADAVPAKPLEAAKTNDPDHWAETLNELSVVAEQPKASRVVVDRSDRLVRVYGEGDTLVAQFPASVGSKQSPLPIGAFKINGVSRNPPYQYNPARFWDADPDDKKAKLPPGPNGPVGVVWIDLSKDHYGIHGTPEPEMIGRSFSHGCVRLTNWDAARLAQMVGPGTPVVTRQ